MVRESGNASARTRQQARAKRSQCACSAASSGSMCDARGSCVTRVVCAPSGPAPRGWPSGVDCRRRTYVARATAVVPATRPSPDVETAVEKGEMSERPHHSHRPSSPIGPLNEKGLNSTPCDSSNTSGPYTNPTRWDNSDKQTIAPTSPHSHPLERGPGAAATRPSRPAHGVARGRRGGSHRHSHRPCTRARTAARSGRGGAAPAARRPPTSRLSIRRAPRGRYPKPPVAECGFIAH